VNEHIFITQRAVFSGWHDYKLAVGCSLHQAPNGDILAWWLSGSDDEPARDNCGLLARSTDGGKTWSEPRVIVPAGQLAGTLGPMHSTRDGRLIALGAWLPSDKNYTVWHYFRIESDDNGWTWSQPEPLALRPANDIAPGQVIRLDNGEYMLAAQFFEQRVQPLQANAIALAGATTEAAALGLPPAAEGERRPGKFGTHLHGCSVFVTARDDLRDLHERGRIANRPLGLLEPTIVQLQDRRIVMLMRAEWGGYLWRAESSDYGCTWTEAWQTDIPNPTSLACVLRLADGRIALLHNARGGKPGWFERSPLSIWISDDELVSWRIKVDIATMTPMPRPASYPPDRPDQLAYPSGLVLADGRFVFGYDRNRRQAMFVEVDIR
jgi:hypothetical protein